MDGAWLEEEVQWRLVSALCLIPSACREMSGLVLDMLLLPCVLSHSSLGQCHR